MPKYIRTTLLSFWLLQYTLQDFQLPLQKLLLLLDLLCHNSAEQISRMATSTTAAPEVCLGTQLNSKHPKFEKTLNTSLFTLISYWKPGQLLRLRAHCLISNFRKKKFSLGFLSVYWEKLSEVTVGTQGCEIYWLSIVCTPLRCSEGSEAFAFCKEIKLLCKTRQNRLQN